MPNASPASGSICMAIKDLQENSLLYLQEWIKYSSNALMLIEKEEKFHRNCLLWKTFLYSAMESCSESGKINGKEYDGPMGMAMFSRELWMKSYRARLEN